jgi:hypothetical protein
MAAGTAVSCVGAYPVHVELGCSVNCANTTSIQGPKGPGLQRRGDTSQGTQQVNIRQGAREQHSGWSAATISALTASQHQQRQPRHS